MSAYSIVAEFFPRVVRLCFRVLITNQQAAQLCIIAAQTAAFADVHLCSIKHSLYHVLQALGGGGIAAVRDMEPAVGIAVLLEFQHDALQRTMLTTGLAENIQLSGLTCLSDDPDAQHPRHSSNGRLHAAIAGQIGQRFQREEQMGVLVVAEHLFTDLVKLLALSQQIPGFSCWYSSAASWAAL